MTVHHPNPTIHYFAPDELWNLLSRCCKQKLYWSEKANLIGYDKGAS